MINKKAVANLSVGLIMAIALGLVFIIFGLGGGAVKIFEIGKFAKQVPVWIWVILIIAYLFNRSSK